MGVIMAVQLLAIGYAAHLVRRTKYSVIWILCIVCFVTSFVQHFIYIFSDKSVDFEVFIAFDVILSACLAMAVFFANRLVNYINNLNAQREVLSKQLLSTVLRTEERSRSQFAKELHDGMGPLLSSAKMSLSAISTENMSEQQHFEQSYIGRLGKACEPVFEPIGLNWKSSVALISGIAAKEVIVSTIGVLYSADDEVDSEQNLHLRLANSGDFSKASILALLVFTLLYFPCVATLATIASEYGKRWAAASALYSTVVAWVLAFVVYHIVG